MSARRSLRHVLARQWIAFGLTLFAAFAAMTLLLMYLLEDSFIDARLREVAEGIVEVRTATLPDRFSLQPTQEASAELRQAMRGGRPGGIREFRQADGRYVHALAGRDADGQAYLLTYDVTQQMRVNQSLVKAGPWLLLIAALLVLVAWMLASTFVSRIGRQAQRLVAQVDGSVEPEELRSWAAAQDILEFGELARLAADSWQARLAALEQERETLRYLGHELRTPLQSARTSLALLQDDRGNEMAWQRLRRAQDRLARASHSVLWLAAGTTQDAGAECDVTALLRQLVEEFEPLATRRGQRLQCDAPAALTWPLPLEVAETVLANLVLNAVQHGGAGVISLRGDVSGLVVLNPPGDESSAGGFGLGLTLSRRLLQRFGWSLHQERPDGQVVATRVSAPGAR